MTSTVERLMDEQRFHDQQAARRRLALADADLIFDDDSYLDHETWIRPAFDLLGDPAGKRILDLGCGHGMASVVLARRGASVTAVDLSRGYLQEAERRARVNGVRVSFACADGNRLPFTHESFDAVFGNAVLHHLTVPQAAAEIRRVLRPAGRVVLAEPWGGNRLLEWARASLPYAGKERTTGERPLSARDFWQFRKVFPNSRIQGFQLFGMFARAAGRGRLIRRLQGMDAWILRHFPIIQNYCRYILIFSPTPEM